MLLKVYAPSSAAAVKPDVNAVGAVAIIKAQSQGMRFSM